MKKDIIIRSVNNIVFPFDLTCGNGDMLLIGELNGAFGTLDEKGELISSNWENNLPLLYQTLKNKHMVRLVSPKETAEYVGGIIKWLIKNTDLTGKHLEYFRFSDINRNGNEETELPFNEYIPSKLLDYINKKNMKFDAIIQNPPYSGSLHLDFLEKGFELLSDKGKMVIIEPATWLINLRKNGRAKKYDELKKKLEGHIESVIIENLNKDFGTGLYVPFATTTIDMSKTFGKIKFACCGEKLDVDSIYDCNLIGKYTTIWGVLEKCQRFGDMMKNHITKEDKGEDMWYTKYAEILSMNLCGGGDGRFKSDEMYRKHNGIDFYLGYTASGFHSDKTSDIQDYPNERRDKGGNKIEGSIADCIYGTKEELENWKHFIFNNKLPLFLNIVLTIDQHNNSKEFLPWLVDKQYTDEEINKLFGFTEEEIALIDRTIKKYERNSPWFKRYMCGPDAVSDEDVNNFINSLNTNA